MPLFGGGGSTKVESKPWEGQRDFLYRGFQTAEDVLQNQIAAGPYQGQTYAGINPAIDQAWQHMQAGGAAGAGAGANLMAQGQSAAAATADYGKSAQDAQAALTNPNTDDINRAKGAFTNPNALSKSYDANALKNLASTGNYGDLMKSANNKVGTDQTGNISKNLSSYMDNRVIGGQINALARDLDRGVMERQLPGMNMEASAGGNTNSSRAGVAEGIIKRGRDEALVDGAAQLRGNAYNSAMGAALQDQELTNRGIMQGAEGVAGANQQAAGQGMAAAGIRQQDHSTALGAALDAEQMGNNAIVQGQQLVQGANAQAAGQIGQGQAINQSGVDQISQAGIQQQFHQQAQLNDQQARFNNETGGWVNNAMREAWPVIGGQQYGQQSTQQGGQTGSTLGGMGQLLGGAGMIASLFA